MKHLWLAGLALVSAGCIESMKATAAPGAQGSMLVQPGQSPPPSTPDPAMPTSLAPPAAAANLAQTNGMYKTGSTFFVIGGTLLGVGIAFTVVGVVVPCKLGDTGCSTAADVQSEKNMGDTFIAMGVASLIAGAVFVGLGIPFAIIGANQVKREMGYALLVGPQGVGLRF